MSNNKGLVYCIIVSYNAMPWIDSCLCSLRESIVPIIPIVIDNCSKDETISHIKKYYPETIVIENDKNKGFGQANNQGIEYAYKHNGEFFFLLNQDAFVYPDTVGNLLRVFEANNIAVASPVHLNGDGSRMDGGFFDSAIKTQRNVVLVSDLFLKNVKPYYSVSFVNAAAWMLSKRAIETIGGFDPVFFHYGEDVNYSQRLKYHQLTLAVVPEAIIHHCRKDDGAGNQEIYNERAYLMNLLINTADVNSTKCFYGRLKLGHQIRNIVSLLIRGRISSCKRVTSACVYIISKRKDINKSILINKQIGMNWLNL